MSPPDSASAAVEEHGGAEALKTCCAAGYSSDLVSLLLGESYHPGGLDLTRQLFDRMGLAPGQRLLDIASGIGTTALLAATEYGVRVDGVDLSEANAARAAEAATTRGLSDLVTFQPGDAEALPLPDAAWDAVVTECALCTFPDKQTAVREMARVLKPGGRLGITDVTADRERLPPELTNLEAWIACVADARSTEEYRELLAGAGLRVLEVEQHQPAIDRMIRHLDARFELLRMTSRARLEQAGVDFDRVRPVLEAARHAVRDGVLGYVLLVAEKPLTAGNLEAT